MRDRQRRAGLWRRRSERGDRGAALVEAAIVLPVVALIIFGIIEFGFLFASAQTTNGSARAGARVAAANYAGAPDKTAAANEIRLAVEEDLANLSGQADPQELWIYKAGTTGAPLSDPSFASCPSECLRFTWGGTSFGSLSGAWASPDACGANVDAVGVYVSIRHNFITQLFRSDEMVEESTVMRLEPLAFNVCPAGST